MSLRDGGWSRRREKDRSPEKKADRRSALNELSNLPQDVQDLYFQTEHEVMKHKVENESLKEAVVLLRSQQQGLQEEVRALHQNLQDKEEELARATTRADALYQDFAREQNNVTYLESVVVQLKQEKAQFEQELIASQKRTQDEHLLREQAETILQALQNDLRKQPDCDSFQGKDLRGIQEELGLERTRMELAWLEKTRRRRKKAADNRLNFSSRGRGDPAQEQKEGTSEDKKLLVEATEEVERLAKMLESEQDAKAALTSQESSHDPLIRVAVQVESLTAKLSEASQADKVRQLYLEQLRASILEERKIWVQAGALEEDVLNSIPHRQPKPSPPAPPQRSSSLSPPPTSVRS